MVKLDIEKALVDGFRIIKDRPIVILPIAISSIIWLVLSYYVKSTLGFTGNEFMVSGDIDPGLMHREFVDILAVIVTLTVVAGLLSLFLDGLAIRMVYDATFGEISYGSVGFVIRKYLTLLLASIVVMVILLPAFILIIPGIYLSVRLSFVVKAILIDEDGVIASLKKSWKIVKGKWWRTLALSLVIMVFMAISYFTLGTIIAIGILAGFNENTLAHVGNIIKTVIEAIVGTWGIAAFVMAYLQLTERQKTSEGEVLGV